MGNSDSKQPLDQKDFILERQVKTDIYGPGSIYKNPKTGQKLIAIQRTLQNQNQMKTLIDQLKQEELKQTNNDVKLVKHIQQQSSDICSSMIKLLAVYDFYEKSLAGEYKDRNKNGAQFTEPELFYILTICLYLIEEMVQTRKLKDIQLKNLTIDKDGILRLFSCSLLKHETSYSKALSRQHIDEIYLSPEELYYLQQNKKDPMIDFGKSMVFQVGMLILKLASNSPYEMYQLDKFHINSSGIDKNIQQVQVNGYSSFLIYTLQVLLNPEINERESAGNVLNNLGMAQQQGNIIVADRIRPYNKQQHQNDDRQLHQNDNRQQNKNAGLQHQTVSPVMLNSVITQNPQSQSSVPNVSNSQQNVHHNDNNYQPNVSHQYSTLHNNNNNHQQQYNTSQNNNYQMINEPKKDNNSGHVNNHSQSTNSRQWKDTPDKKTRTEHNNPQIRSYNNHPTINIPYDHYNNDNQHYNNDNQHYNNDNQHYNNDNQHYNNSNINRQPYMQNQGNQQSQIREHTPTRDDPYQNLTKSNNNQQNIDRNPARNYQPQYQSRSPNSYSQQNNPNNRTPTNYSHQNNYDNNSRNPMYQNSDNSKTPTNHQNVDNDRLPGHYYNNNYQTPRNNNDRSPYSSNYQNMDRSPNRNNHSKSPNNNGMKDFDRQIQAIKERQQKLLSSIKYQSQQAQNYDNPQRQQYHNNGHQQYQNNPQYQNQNDQPYQNNGQYQSQYQGHQSQNSRTPQKYNNYSNGGHYQHY